MRIPGKWLTAGGLAVALATVMPAMATAAGGRPAAAGGRAAGRAASARSDASGSVSPAVLASLSPQQLAGQRVIYSYSGLTPPASLISLIKHGEAAGVIFFGQNISSKAQIANVIKQLDQANASSQNPVQAPLLLMTDQEGGEVRRLPGRPFLSEKQIGANSQAESLATEAGQGAASNLRSVGMNVNLAPVLDVYRKAGDFDDQFGRSYSKDSNLVADLGTRMITAQQAGGVAATAKHFPGLGAASASQNTDVGPVTLNLSANTLRTVDEVPFAAAIQAGVKLVMVSWAVYPALGARPAGLSSNVVQGVLRNRLHFTGVTITDALEAGALRAFGSTQHRTLRAALAGMDLILCSAQTVTQGEEASGELAADYADGTLNNQDFQDSVARVIALRQSLK
jgi:beta-N-acetylhexosaminidase